MAELTATGFWSGVAAPLRSWSLSRQFALTGGFIMLVAMLLAGQFTSHMVSRAAIEDSANASALFMQSFIAPLVQKLATSNELPPDALNQLDRLLEPQSFQERFPHVDIWKNDGLIVYSRTKDLIGRRFNPPDGLKLALSGTVSARYTDLEAGEHVLRGFHHHFLEIYVPVREDQSGRIIAVAEIHEVTAPLEDKLWRVRLESWVAVIGASALIMLGLFGVVHRAGKVIDGQQSDLRRRMAQIEQVSRQNRLLRDKAQTASSRIAELTESQLRRIGAELHDGPAQLIGLAALSIDHVRCAPNKPKREEELRKLALTLDDALRDIRSISKGLMLPEIEHLTLCEVIDKVVRIHRQRTDTAVSVHCLPTPQSFSHAVRLCVYRFVQEGLNNAFRHAGGEGQRVECIVTDALLVVRVKDRGNGRTAAHDQTSFGPGLGLSGLRERVESLGGTFHIHLALDGGTMIEMTLVLEETHRNG